MVWASPAAKSGYRGPPTELGAQLGRVDGVAQVVTGPIGHVLVVVAGPAQQFEDGLDDLMIVLLPVRADQVGLPDPPLPGDQQHGRAVVVGMDPVAYVLPGAVQLGSAAVEHVGDLARNELLHVLVRAVVVGAVADRGRDAERTHPRPDQQVGSGLGRGVRAGRVVRRLLGEPGRLIQFKVAIDLVGGDVVVAGAVPADRLQQRVGADEVGGQERRRVAQRVVVVGLGREVHHLIVGGHQIVDQIGVTDVTQHEAEAPLGQARRGRRGGRRRSACPAP